MFHVMSLVVRLDVLGEVVGAHELLVALGALEALLAGVRPAVPLQLVGAREPLAAEEPAADEGALAAVPAQVRPQVRRLAVDLVAAVHVADVLLLARLPVGVGVLGAAAVAVLAVRARAGHATETRLASGTCGLEFEKWEFYT